MEINKKYALDMVRLSAVDAALLLIFVDAVYSFQPNTTLNRLENDLKGIETRRKSKDRSTSSSSGAGGKSSDGNDGDSLDLTESSASSSSKEYTKYPKLKSSGEYRGWRKWHRKCTICPDRSKKWRDPSIGWVCGAYQRARRSFKSSCMMYYRNCQDGTMFVKIHDGRCKNDSSKEQQPHGDHFFYEYKVDLSDDDSSETSASDSSSSLESSSSFS